MNKKELIKEIKKYLFEDASFYFEITEKKVYFSLYSFDNREVCCLEIPYKNRLDKQSIYVAIADLITRFDFSFRITFDNTKDIYEFLEV